MVELISRNNVFKQCPQLTQHLMGYQQAMYNPSDDISVKGDEAFLRLDDEAPTVLTQKQADQLNIEHMAYCMARCDEFQTPRIKVTFFEGIIAELDVLSFGAFTQNIGKSMVRLSSTLGWDNIMIISDARHPYLGQENAFEPVQNAIQNLLTMGMARTSIEGIKLNKDTIADFFASIFWIVRCNGSAPGICFSSPNSNIIGTLCKYGNIHFECFDEVETGLLKEALRMSNFREVPNGICVENFSPYGAIDGRKLSI